jgi:cytochrome c-type biogenesis protein
MLAFGFGAALPLVFVGLLSRETLLRWRVRLIAGGAGVKLAFAIMLVSIGALVLSGFDKRIETGVVDISPQWLTNITTRF